MPIYQVFDVYGNRQYLTTEGDRIDLPISETIRNEIIRSNRYFLSEHSHQPRQFI